jgi:hypothetical protein
MAAGPRWLPKMAAGPRLRKYKHWTAVVHEKVMYSDESTFCVIKTTETLDYRISLSDTEV